MTWFARPAAAMAVAALALAVPAPAHAAPGRQCAPAGQVVAEIPWAQQMLTPERVWPLTRGGGVTVAVLATGVDAGHPQLAGRVRPGFDAVAGGGHADSDCTGAGTQVAGVIAAQPVAGVGFAGLAPQATILPVRVVPDDPAHPSAPSPQALARGITWAAHHGAAVIAVPVVVQRDTAVLRGAVAKAVSRGIIVVAAAGDLGAPSDGNPKPYPAGYDNVVGVGAVTAAGQRWPQSQRGDWVDLVAPGADVQTLQRGRGMTQAGGTGLATGFVAAAATLTWAKRGDLLAPEVARILVATASPAPLGQGFGAGVVNPYAAVSDQVIDRGATPLVAPVSTVVPVPKSWLRSRDTALAGTGVAALAVFLTTVLSVAFRRGRRRSWRPSAAIPLPRSEEPGEPGPPLALFDEQRPPLDEQRRR
jgi:membrane-anchored mycosin MYCP